MTTIEFATPVQVLIPQVEERMRNQSNGYHAELGIALNHLLAAGGKRVRPTIALLVSSILGVEQERAITLAAAIELLHTATLVHDDLIDGAMMRRGYPTLNAQWNSALTVLAGDFLFSQAAYLAAEVDSITVMRMFAKTLSVIVNGEIGQVLSLKARPSRSEYYGRIYAKTASLFELSAIAPAYLTDENDQLRDALGRYGHGVGMAFQIVDDVLDFSSDIDTIGKPVAHDLSQGLLTLPALYFAEENPNDKVIARLRAGESVETEEILGLVTVIRESGALQKSLDEAEEHQLKAMAALEHVPAGVERQALTDLAEYVLARLH